jgi:hypothetical protein
VESRRSGRDYLYYKEVVSSFYNLLLNTMPSRTQSGSSTLKRMVTGEVMEAGLAKLWRLAKADGPTTCACSTC